MIELNDAKMKAILRFIVSLMRDDTVMNNCYIRGMEDEEDTDLMEIIEYLYEITHQHYYHEPYRNMFHWANKVGSLVNEDNIDMIINDMVEEEKCIKTAIVKEDK
jgi:hypothetical protein